MNNKFYEIVKKKLFQCYPDSEYNNNNNNNIKKRKKAFSVHFMWWYNHDTKPSKDGTTEENYRPISFLDVKIIAKHYETKQRKYKNHKISCQDIYPRNKSFAQQ